jgi:hypothetical protein
VYFIQLWPDRLGASQFDIAQRLAEHIDGQRL